MQFQNPFGGGKEAAPPQQMPVIVAFKDRDSESDCVVKKGNEGYYFYLNNQLILTNTKVQRGSVLGKGENTLFFWGDGEYQEALVENVEESEIEKVMAAGIPFSPPPGEGVQKGDPNWLVLTAVSSAVLILLLFATIVIPYVTGSGGGNLR
eukprot:CAMPEP_0169076678 /NCGR_PEP_ID=MMETSP1015-20121227/8477_1 /TAXON_ID=342587 /ORGANISM="Karlodinium micrum, Strain CCMP2283" /LENGTH=150 /DNA_ID=CAMNT_0009136159 /DNA_START=249 /DNA_END=701 /DNA_ORIENTATION=+